MNAGQRHTTPLNATAAPRIPVRTGVLLILLLTSMRLAQAAAAAEGDERALWGLWSVQQAAPHDHAAVLAACRTFKKSRPEDPFVAVADTLAAWHLLSLARTAEAAAMLEGIPARPSEPVANGAYAVATAWLTRVDMERVEQALQFHYRREIGYPAKLKELAAYTALPGTMAFPVKDRWGLPWNYRLVGYSRLPGLLNQKYELQSQKLGSGSRLAPALAAPYGKRINIRMLGVRSTSPGREVVEMEILPAPAGPEALAVSKGRTVLVGVNAWAEGVFLAYVGKRIILVCDRSYWMCFPNPQPGSRL